MVTYPGGFDCLVDGAVLHQVSLPSYPAVEAVADTSEDAVLVKIVNFTDREEDIRLDLDIDVKPDYTADLLTGDPDGKNTLEEPDNITVAERSLTGAGRSFLYKAPPWSLHVLELKKAAAADIGG